MKNLILIEELCARIREKRKELNYTIEEVVEGTKLDPAVIRDIEEGNFSRIAPPYLRGFIKIYASFLGIDVGEALKISFAPLDTSGESKRKKPKSLIPFEIKKRLGLAAAAILIIIFVFTSIHSIKNILTKESSKKSEKGEAAFSFPEEDVSGVVATIMAKRNCFLRVKTDNKLLFEGILKRGATESWEAKKLIDLKISDGTAVSIEVNGKMLPPLTSLRKPIKSLKITPTGISVDK